MEYLFLGGLVLGLTGSLHCVSMCSPLLLMVEKSALTSLSPAIRRIVYHLGRISVYAIGGFAIGSFSSAAAFSGYQLYLSLLAGVLLLVAATFPLWKKGNPFPSLSITALLKPIFTLTRKLPAIVSHFFLGVGNGFLPCGLVYAALGASLMSATATGSAIFMVSFGIGTVPALAAVLIVGKMSRFSHVLSGTKARTIAYVVVGTMLVLRGLALDIPYISPVLSPTLDDSCIVE